MYKLKPIYGDQVDVRLPNCMYSIGNVHATDRSNVDQDEDSPWTALERRQDAIIAKVEQLTSDVAKLLNNIHVGNRSVVKHTSCPSSVKKDVDYHDIVINANPKHPPLSLIVLHQLFTPRVHCFTSVYVHSSVTSIQEELKNCFPNGSGSRSNAQLAFTFIWKDVCHGAEMVIRPVSQSPIHGEANIARYLARLLDADYEANPEVATTIDAWIDMAALLTTKQKASVLKSLNARLGKRTWLAGSSLSLADIVTWSYLIQLGQTNGLPSNVKKWLQACNGISAFQFAKQLLEHV